MRSVCVRVCDCMPELHEGISTVSLGGMMKIEEVHYSKKMHKHAQRPGPVSSVWGACDRNMDSLERSLSR